MNENAAAVQIYTGESASFVHHAAAAVQGALGVTPEVALGVTLFGSVVAFLAVLAPICARLEARRR